MNKLLGIAGNIQAVELFREDYLKQLAVLLDSLVICSYNGRRFPGTYDSEEDRHVHKLIEWLENDGFLKWGANPNEIAKEEVEEHIKLIEQDPDFQKLRSFYIIKGIELDEKLGIRHGYVANPTGPYDPLWHSLARQTALRLYKYENTDAVPITFHDPLIDKPGQVANYDDVIRLVLKNIPAPGPLTPWEEIRDFRDDEEAKAAQRRLRLWSAEVVRNKMPIYIAEQKLEDLLHEYRTYMQLHFKDIYPSFLETLIVGTASFIEDIIKIKAGSLAKRLFSVNHRKTKLLIAEKKAPGREISFIVKAQETFL